MVTSFYLRVRVYWTNHYRVQHYSIGALHSPVPSVPLDLMLYSEHYGPVEFSYSFVSLLAWEGNEVIGRSFYSFIHYLISEFPFCIFSMTSIFTDKEGDLASVVLRRGRIDGSPPSQGPSPRVLQKRRVEGTG